MCRVMAAQSSQQDIMIIQSLRAFRRAGLMYVMLQCNVAMLQCCDAAMLQCCTAAWVQGLYGARMQMCSGEKVQWLTGTCMQARESKGEQSKESRQCKIGDRSRDKHLLDEGISQGKCVHFLPKRDFCR